VYREVSCYGTRVYREVSLLWYPGGIYLGVSPATRVVYTWVYLLLPGCVPCWVCTILGVYLSYYAGCTMLGIHLSTMPGTMPPWVHPGIHPLFLGPASTDHGILMRSDGALGSVRE